MCQHLGIALRPQPFLFSFSSISGFDRRSTRHQDQEYFLHATNNHIFPPPRPVGSSTLVHCFRCIFVLFLSWWFTICCISMPAKNGTADVSCETFRQYLQRIRLPSNYIECYLLPLLSSISTCDHETILSFPASDILRYHRYLVFGRTLRLSDGVEALEKELVKGINMHFHCEIQSVRSQAGQVMVVRRQIDFAGTVSIQSELFDNVVLAVSPDVVAKIYKPLRVALTSVPISKVMTIVHTDTNAIPFSRGDCYQRNSEKIHLRTLAKDGQPSCTEATHAPRLGIFITTNPIAPINPASVLQVSTFTRVLRTPCSRRILNAIFASRHEADHASPHTRLIEKRFLGWSNGDDGVFLVGSWCWDGMGKGT
jgi:hypothetical protein